MPVNTRTASQTTILPTGGGPDRSSPVMIRKGENIAFCVYAMHRRVDLYGEDAEDFRPERWDEDLPLFEDEYTSSWGYLPFNGGPRICLGRMSPASMNRYCGQVKLTCYISAEDFALTEVAYTVARILQKFSKLTPGDTSRSQRWFGYSSHHTTPVEKFSRYKQKATLVLSSGEGCSIVFQR